MRFSIWSLLQSKRIKRIDEPISETDFHLEFAAIETGDNSILIPKAKTDTYITISYVKGGPVILVLNDIAGEPIIGEKITYTLNSGDSVDDETDMYGHVYINGLSGENKITAIVCDTKNYNIL